MNNQFYTYYTIRIQPVYYPKENNDCNYIDLSSQCYASDHTMILSSSNPSTFLEVFQTKQNFMRQCLIYKKRACAKLNNHSPKQKKKDLKQ